MKNALLADWNFYLEGFRSMTLGSYIVGYYPSEIIRHVLHPQIILFPEFP